MADRQPEAFHGAPSAIGPSSSEIAKRLDFLWNTPLAGSREYSESFSGRQVGPYAIEQPIGAGAFGVVYRGCDARDGRLVAIKFLRSELVGNREAVARFESEVSANLRLNHEAIVPIYGADLSISTPYIATAYCNGPDLAQWMEGNQARRRDYHEIADFVITIVDAIAHAHSQGVIHRDIKPSNIMMISRVGMTSSERLTHYAPKLTDFGLAKLTIDPIVSSRSSVVIGTPMYMATEQLIPSWGPVTERTDIFALGAILFELAEGEPPRFGRNYASIIASLLREASLARELRWKGDVPPGFRQIVEKCLENDPVDRYANAEALKGDLKAFLDGEILSSSSKSFAGLRSMLKWARHPKRPTEICFFTISLNVVLFLWMTVNSLLMFRPEFQGNSQTIDLIECVGLSAAHNLVIVGLCLGRLYGYRGSLPIAFLVNLVVAVALPTLMLLGWISFLNAIYPNAPYYRTAILALILLFGIFKSILLCIGTFSDLAASLRAPSTPSRHFSDFFLRMAGRFLAFQRPSLGQVE